MARKALQYDPQIQDYLRSVSQINSPKQHLDSLFKLKCEGRQVGILKDELPISSMPEFRSICFRIVTQLAEYSEVFHLNREERSVEVNPSLKDFKSRTDAIAKVMDALREKKVIGGWRNELYPVAEKFNEDPYFLVERAATVTLGIKAYGVHINGYVMKDNKMSMWVAKRSPVKPTWPSKLDQIVAGGQPHGISLMENVIKECEEEAGIPSDLAKKATPAGAVSYACVVERGVKSDVLFVYDLVLPEDFVPKPNDGEVESFTLMPIEEVSDIIRTTDLYKPNCALVIIEFLIRHGLVLPDQNGYLDLLSALRGGQLC